MKTIFTFIVIMFSVALSAQQGIEELLASNEVNTGKTQQSILASQFQDLDAATLDGVYKILDDRGAVKEVRTFSEGKLDGTWLKYDDQKNLIAVANYKNDLKHGKWMIWDSNGVKRYELQYDHGNRAGTWSSWNEKGELLSTTKY